MLECKYCGEDCMIPVPSETPKFFKEIIGSDIHFFMGCKEGQKADITHLGYCFNDIKKIMELLKDFHENPDKPGMFLLEVKSQICLDAEKLNGVTMPEIAKATQQCYKSASKCIQDHMKKCVDRAHKIRKA